MSAHDTLYKLLPAVYRGRDRQGELERFVALFAGELASMRARLDQQWRDQYIDSCQDWIIPYLAELVGTQVLFADAARNRVDVKNTIRWRRRKGTLAGLGELAAGIGGGGALAAEMLERTAWMQNLVHLKRGAPFTPSLRDGDAVAALNTPFSRGRALVDLRRGSQRAGWYGPRKLGIFEWGLASYPVRHAVPAALGGGRYQFAPLGGDVPLYAGGDKQAACAAAGAAGADLCEPYADHVPIRTRDARSHPAAYVGTPSGFSIHEDGIPLVSAQPAAGAPSASPALDFAELARLRGLVGADTTLFAAPKRFTVEAVRLGAVLQTLDGTVSSVGYSGGVAWAAQLQLRNAHGSLALDGVTPSFAYTAGVAPYSPASGEFHHAALLLRITNTGAAASAFPESEVIARNASGSSLQIYLPTVNLSAGNQILFYVATDGSTYYARGDRGPGTPDRNPDASLFGAFTAAQLARAAEGQLRLRPGHPAAPNRFRRAVLRSLCCWDRPLAPPLASGEVAIDPERGRFAFPAGEAPAGRLSVSFRYALTGELGAGPYARPNLAAETLTVAQMRNAQHATVQAAIDAAPDGGEKRVVIRILDSATYTEALRVDGRNFPGGLEIQAADQEMPVLVKPGGSATLLRVQTSTLGELRLDGLVLSGGNVAVSDGVGAVRLRHCSAAPASVTLSILGDNPKVQVLGSICGPVVIATTGEGGSVEIADSVVRELLFLKGVGKLERTTFLGDVTLHSTFASNALFAGNLFLSDEKAGCLRFSRAPAALAAGGFRCTDAVPVFVSTAFGDPGYCHLHPNTAAALRAGGEEGGEIGAFYRAGLPWRAQNVALRLAEYLPAGLEAVQVRVLPRLRFPGNRPL